METFKGYVPTVRDALILFEAVLQNQLPSINRRLSNTERRSIKSGSVFIFEEGSSGVQRWTDGYQWSPSRLHGNFLTYYQKRYASGTVPLIKRTLSVVTSSMIKLVLISYYNNQDLDDNLLQFPSQNPEFIKLSIPDNFYFRRITQQSSGNSAILAPLTGQESYISRTRLPLRTRMYSNSHPYQPRNNISKSYQTSSFNTGYLKAEYVRKSPYYSLPTGFKPDPLSLSKPLLLSIQSSGPSLYSPSEYSSSLSYSHVFKSQHYNLEDQRQLSLFNITI